MAREMLVVQMGGTIDKDYPRSIGGYAFEIGEPAVKRIFARSRLGPSVQFTTVCRKDSQEITPTDLQSLVTTLATATCTRILITHGTDTMLNTARHLSESPVIRDKNMVVVITGSFRPEAFRDSDADFNLGTAVGALQTISQAGIYVAMNGRVGKWDAITRDTTSGEFIFSSC